MSQHDVKNEIVRLLSANEFLSGEELGSKLGMSRAAISKHIKALQQTGLDVFSLQGKGYRLAENIDVISQEQLINAGLSSAIQVDVHNIVSSTNDLAKEGIREKRNGHVYIAEAQTMGRGRHGRQWHSPFGANLYFSMVWHFDGGFQAMSGLSLAVGVALCEACDVVGVPEARVKWPNDVLINDKKLAGILIETEGYSDGSCSAIIGCGVNYRMPGSTETIDQPWTDLTHVSRSTLDRNEVAVALMNALYATLQSFEVEGFESFKDKWEHLDAFKGREVKVSTGVKETLGIASGVDSSGALLLEVCDDDNNKVIKHFHGGEVSVRVR